MTAIIEIIIMSQNIIFDLKLYPHIYVIFMMYEYLMSSQFDIIILFIIIWDRVTHVDDTRKSKTTDEL